MLGHLAVLAIIALGIPRPNLREPFVPITANVWLMPRLMLDLRKPAAQRATAAPVGLTAAPPKAARTAPSPSTVATTPAPAQPSGAAGSPTTNPTGANDGEIGQGVKGALLSRIGCDALTTRLTAEEKDRCNQRFGQEALKGPKYIDPIPEEKRAYYDAIQAAYQAAHDPSHPLVRDVNGKVVPWGKGPGVGCGMKFDGPPQLPDHRSLTDKIKATGLLGFDLGPLECGIVIPQGALTPEIGIATPK